MNTSQKWISLASVQIGGAICLPVLLIGHTLTKTHGLTSSLFAIVAGNFLLMLFALKSASMGVETRKTAAEILEKYVGSIGKKLFSPILASTALIWFAIQTQIIGQDIASMCGFETSLLANSFLAALIAMSCFSGIGIITKCANVMVPLMLLTMGYSLYSSYQSCETCVQESSFDMNSISIVIAAGIGAVLKFPNFFRHAADTKEAKKAVLAIFLVALPLIEITGSLLAYFKGGSTLIEALSSSDIPYYSIWIGFFILLAGWSTNNANFYSAAVTLEATFPAISKRGVALLTTMCVVGLSAVPLVQSLHAILGLLGVVIASLGGSVITAYTLEKRYGEKIGDVPHQLLAVIIGIVATLLMKFQGQLMTNIATLDSFIIAAVMLIAFRLPQIRGGKRAYERT